MPGSLAEQERDARELFGRADRRAPDTNSVVRFVYPASRFPHVHSHSCSPAGFAERLLPLPVQRKHALSHAIKLAHSPYTSLKRMAAVNIAKFFKAFPDLEEDAINAVYDLCEDQDPNVRRCGASFSVYQQLTCFFFLVFFFLADTNRRVQGYRSDVRGAAQMARAERGRASAVTAERYVPSPP